MTIKAKIADIKKNIIIQKSKKKKYHETDNYKWLCAYKELNILERVEAELESLQTELEARIRDHKLEIRELEKERGSRKGSYILSYTNLIHDKRERLNELEDLIGKVCSDEHSEECDRYHLCNSPELLEECEDEMVNSELGNWYYCPRKINFEDPIGKGGEKSLPKYEVEKIEGSPIKHLQKKYLIGREGE